MYFRQKFSMTVRPKEVLRHNYAALLKEISVSKVILYQTWPHDMYDRARFREIEFKVGAGA